MRFRDIKDLVKRGILRPMNGTWAYPLPWDREYEMSPATDRAAEIKERLGIDTIELAIPRCAFCQEFIRVADYHKHLEDAHGLDVNGNKLKETQ